MPVIQLAIQLEIQLAMAIQQAAPVAVQPAATKAATKAAAVRMPPPDSSDSPDTPDNTPPAVVADLAGTVSSLTNIALTWTEPTDEDFSHLLIRWQPAGPMGSTQQPLRVNKGTQTATITGLAQATSYSFTAESVDATGNQSVASTASGASMVMTELRPILALFSAGQEDGDFGLGSSGRCQTRLDDSTYAIGAELKSRGYTKAVFFGSTPTYDFIDLATDPDALGISGQTPAALAARGVSLFSLASTSAVTETTMFEDATSGLEMDKNRRPASQCCDRHWCLADGWCGYYRCYSWQ